jgi:SAM-dependent methyltransferase
MPAIIASLFASARFKLQTPRICEPWLPAAWRGHNEGMASPASEADRAARRARVIGALADAVGALGRDAPVHVAVDALAAGAGAGLADDLAATLTARGRRCRRASPEALGHHRRGGPAPGDDVVIVDGSFLQLAGPAGLRTSWDLVIYLRQPVQPGPDPDRARAVARYLAEIDPERAADVVVEHDDPTWPVIRRVAPAVADRLGRDLHPDETRAFFAPRAASWEQRFPDDDRAYAAAVADLGLRAGQTALDVGCGTARALPHLRRAVGPAGAVLGVDLTPEMLATARRYGRHLHGWLVLADARRLPLPAGGVDGAFAAGLLPHLPDPDGGLTELARVTRPGGRLGLFHPSGRAALAARQGRRLRDDDTLAQATLHRLLERTGWRLDRYDDAPDRFLAVAERIEGVLPHASRRRER